METTMLSLVSLVGWLVLAFFAYRSHRVDAKKSVVMALQWGAIFLAVFWVFTLVRG